MAVLITGANRGIGKGLRDHYAAAGSEVFGTHRGDPTGDMIRLDVTNPDSLCDLAGAWGDRSLDLLVCNAGVYLDRDEGLETGYAADIWAQTFAANVTGVFATIQALLPALRASRGKIAIVSSQMASDTLAPGGSYAYRASKAAALNLGRNLASDLRGDGIAVGIYHPGWVRTDMGTEAATISVDESVAGLVDRFAALSLETTGCFENWDGRPHPF